MNVECADPKILVSSSIDDAWECPIMLKEGAGIRRVGEPVSLGIPLPRGTISDASQLGLVDDKGRPIPVQGQVLARWADGSAQWVLVDFLVHVEPYAMAVYQIIPLRDLQPADVNSKLKVIQEENRFIIDTGCAQFQLNSKVLKPFDSIRMKGHSLMSSQGTSVVLLNDKGEAFHPVIENITLEVAGPIRATLCLEGVFLNDSSRFARFLVRMSFYENSGLVEMKNTIHNPKAAQHPGGLWDLGDEGSVFFQDLSMQIPFDSEKIEWNAHPSQPFHTHYDSSLEIYQDSSGGQNWNGSNHCNGDGKIVPAFPGYQIKKNEQMVQEGSRALPTCVLDGHGVRVEGSIEHFWQNFPKAIEANPNGMTFRLFPRQCQDLFELQGGEQKTQTLFMQFSSASDQASPLVWIHERIVPTLSAEWHARSEAIPYLTPRTIDTNHAYLDLIDSAVDGGNTFFHRREIIDEYGWRNFGDLYGDHEAVGHTGPAPKVSHYNNQYDVINGALIEFFRSGDARWFELMRDLARHVIDVDLYHTTEDRPEYNGGMFWHTDHYFDAGTASHRAYSKGNANPENPTAYGGGPSNEQNYTTGLLHYYYLTGDPQASEAVLSLANWVLRMDEGGRHWLKYIDSRPTGSASASAGRSYHGPGRGAGNSINALLDAYRIVPSPEYLEKAESLIRRCIHPYDVIEDRNLGDVEYRWSYTVFLQTLGKYLDFKLERSEIDEMYVYAQASLLHYADWMMTHELPYQQVMHKVNIPTETWPAQDIRKSNVFKFAAKHSEGFLREAFLQKSNFFFQSCVTDLRSYATAHLARPIVLLLVNGYMHASFTSNPEQQGVILKEYPDFGIPKSFTPQLAEIYRLKEMADGWLQKIQSWVSGKRT